VLAGVTWWSIDIQDEVNSGAITGTVDETISGIQPYLGFRVILGG